MKNVSFSVQQVKALSDRFPKFLPLATDYLFFKILQNRHFIFFLLVKLTSLCCRGEAMRAPCLGKHRFKYLSSDQIPHKGLTQF